MQSYLNGRSGGGVPCARIPDCCSAHPQVVAYLRTNLVKWAVSVLRGSAVRARRATLALFETYLKVNKKPITGQNRPLHTTNHKPRCGWNPAPGCGALEALGRQALSTSQVIRQIYKRAQARAAVAGDLKMPTVKEGDAHLRSV